MQDDTRVVPCDPPAEERCRGVNNTDAAPRIIDSCPDPQDRARCYTAFSENGCGEVYYAGLPPTVAEIICSMCTVLDSIVTFQVSRAAHAPTGISRWGRVVPRATQRCSALCKPDVETLLFGARSMASFRQDHRREHFHRPLQPVCILREQQRRFGCMGRL